LLCGEVRNQVGGSVTWQGGMKERQGKVPLDANVYRLQHRGKEKKIGVNRAHKSIVGGEGREMGKNHKGSSEKEKIKSDRAYRKRMKKK